MTNISAPPDLTDPRHLIHPVAPHVFNRTMGLPFTAPIVPQTPSRVSIGPCYLMTGNSMSNTPARMKSSPTHGLVNGIGNANQTIVPILSNLQSYYLRLFIEIITSRAVGNNTTLLRIDRLNRNLITLKLLIDPITMRVDSTLVTYEQNQSWFNHENILIVEVIQHFLAQTSNSGQDSASIINSATGLIEMKINFSDQHCFEKSSSK